MPQKFSQDSLLKKFWQTLERIPRGLVQRGGFLGPGSVTLHPTYLLAWIGGKDIGPSGPIQETGVARAQTPGGEQAAVGYRPSAEASGMSTEALLREIYKPTTTKTTETTKITTPTPLPKAEITTAKPAPTPTPTPPPPTPPPVAGGARAPTPPATGPGFTAPTLSSLPPAPVQISERAFTGIPTPRPEIPVGQFEAMIRALAELTGGRYVPTPLPGATPFGPTGALERALRRLRERELGIPAT
jgi:hypothetical protein